MEGLDGPLISHHTASHLVWPAFPGQLGEQSAAGAGRRFRACRRSARATLGPASGLRAVLDVAVAPVARLLGFTVHGAVREGDALFGELWAPREVRLGLVVLSWEASLAAGWRATVRDGLARRVPWSFCSNGTHLRVVDIRRSHARRYAGFDLAAAERDPQLFALMWALCRAAAFAANPRLAGEDDTLFTQVVALSARHGVSVCQSLHGGVRLALDRLATALASRASPRLHQRRARQAVARPQCQSGGQSGGQSGRRQHGPGLAEQSLTLVYRLLFLLFAEARRLVPVWHPIYRASYSMAALIDALRSPRPSVGLWSSLQATCRLAHSGCRFEDLIVTPFNGRLFAPARTPLGEAARVSDAVMRDVLLALTTRRTASRREHISYGDLGVEELGAVYERVLDHAVSLDLQGSSRTGERPSTRKETGTFYTPRSITDFLVRRTLAPLVAEARSEDILELKVLDPALGSGAFLVAACRFLAEAYERRLVEEQRAGAGDITDGERVIFRRLVAQRCLYGVDLNPMAVQLARLSLWLASLAADVPLTFLDHHLRVGDSLLGASLADLARRQPGGRVRRARPAGGQIPLFDAETLEADVRATLPDVWRLASDEDTSPEIVTGKERRLASLLSDEAPLAKWRHVLDFWCAAFLRPDALPLSPAIAGGIIDHLVGRESAVPRPLCDAWRTRAAEVANHARLFHWTLEFPEVFANANGAPRARRGFDAVLSNPPWDMLRADTERDLQASSRPGVESNCHQARARTTSMARFVRASGIYATGREAHVNSYQLFVERALQLVRPGGRLGMVLPWGLASDVGSGRLRQRLLDTCTLDGLVGFENTRGVFPIHRGVRFLLLTATASGRTERVPCRFGLVTPGDLDSIPDTAQGEPLGLWTPLPTSLLRRLSGARLTIPHVRSAEDRRFLAHLCTTAPPLGSASGWHVRFGRELNASDDRARLQPPGRGMPVVEGKHVTPFAVDVSASRASLPLDLLGAPAGRLARVRRERLAYRDVAAATNRVSLIAAILPAMTASTHTLFTLETPLEHDDQLFLCAVLNSYVANAYVRLFISNHITTALLETLPVPRPPRGGREHGDITRLGRRVVDDPADLVALAKLQAAVARLYRLDKALYAHVLAGFPLVEVDQRQAAMEAFDGK
ncbi:MAG: Eco57I restriction-modification methylase domain-containing protein [Vicinamibacteraceae bacterium]